MYAIRFSSDDKLSLVGYSIETRADPVGDLMGLQPPLLAATSVTSKGELGKKKREEEENRERRGWGRGGSPP